MKSIKQYHKRVLPHIQEDNGYFAITFRLAWTIPMSCLKEMELELSEIEHERLHSTKDLPKNQEPISLIKYKKYDDLIGIIKNSPKWLQKPEIAEIVSGAIHYFDREKYNLIAYCIMPNHVHLILHPLVKSELEFYTLTEIMVSIKTYTAKKCNRILGRTGQFWCHESYDHQIRNELDLRNQIEYLLYNPVKAHLVPSPEKWTYSWLVDDC